MTDSTAHPSPGQHLATIGHAGRFWETYLEFEDDPTRTDSFKARLVFVPGDPGDEETPYRTAPIIIERSFEDVNRKARAMEEHQLVALLRSVLP